MTDTLRPTLGDRIRLARVRADLSQSDLARAVPCDADTLSRWERGSGEPRVSQLRAIAAACGVDVAALMGPS